MTGYRLTIDWDEVDKLLIRGCSGVECSAYLGINHHTLYNRCEKEHGIPWHEYRKAKKAKGDSLLRAKQYEIAMAGDRGMLIWLGKNRLDQSDKFDQNVNGSVENVKKVVLELPDNGRRKASNEVELEDFDN